MYIPDMYEYRYPWYLKLLASLPSTSTVISS